MSMQHLRVLAIPLLLLGIGCNAARTSEPPQPKPDRQPTSPNPTSAAVPNAPELVGPTTNPTSLSADLLNNWSWTVYTAADRHLDRVRAWWSVPSPESTGELPYILHDNRGHPIQLGVQGIEARFDAQDVTFVLGSVHSDSLPDHQRRVPSTVSMPQTGLPVTVAPDLFEDAPQAVRTLEGIAEVFTKFPDPISVGPHSVRDQFHLTVPPATIEALYRALGTIEIRKSPRGAVAFLFTLNGKRQALTARREVQELHALVQGKASTKPVRGISMRTDLVLIDSSTAGDLEDHPEGWPTLVASLTDL